MTETTLKGKVQTVTGTVEPDTLGPTTTHEHLLIDFSCMFNEPDEATEWHRAHQPVTLENLGWVRYQSFANLDNLMLIDEEAATAEAMIYMRAGGGTIVDATTLGIGRDPLALARIARATGLNIVMGAGYYVDAVHPDGMDGMTEADITQQIIDEVRVGVGQTRVKAGIIGEIGCSWPLTPNERKVLRAAALAQQETGAAVLIHPGRNPQAPQEVLDVLAEAGGDVGRTIMGHLDRTLTETDDVLALAKSGCYLEYDLFGWEVSYYSLGDLDMPNDAQRLGFIQRLVAEGYRDRVVMAQDIFAKHRTVKYGGHGYAHILDNIVPRMREKGFSAEEIDAIIVANPARVLTFA
jgi:phosphotriesterase-related protein